MIKIVFKTSIVILLTILVTLVGLYIISPVEKPISWKPPANPGLTGDYAVNDRLYDMQILFAEELAKPEDSTIGPDGLLYTGLSDGRIVRMQPDAKDSSSVETFVNTRGRPLGLRFDARGNLFVADAVRGVLSISPNGDLRVLTDSFQGAAMLFVDHLDVAGDGTVWFSDGTTRYPYPDHGYDMFEGSSTGRLLSYSPDSGNTQVHIEGLRFANGVAVAHDDSYVLVAESITGRIHRLWLSGEKAGEQEVFIDEIPGVPDNIVIDEFGIVWVAIPVLRAPLDWLSDKPSLRRLLAALPHSLVESGAHCTIVLGYDLSGKLVYNLQASNGQYHTITGVSRMDNKLFLSSLEMNGLARVTLP